MQIWYNIKGDLFQKLFWNKLDTMLIFSVGKYTLQNYQRNLSAAFMELSQE